MRTRQCIRTAALGLLVLALAACATDGNTPTPSGSTTASPAPSASDVLLLTPIPVSLQVPAALRDALQVTPLSGPDIDALAAQASVQVQYRASDGTNVMVGNVHWFALKRFNVLMAAADAPKGITLGIEDSHVLFVQPALDMPFDPASADGQHYGTLVTRVRAFSSYAMQDATQTLLRPCPMPDAWPTTPVTKAIRTVLQQHFADKGLTPITISGDAKVLDVEEQAVGEHRCANPEGPEGGYVGAVPVGSTEAVMVFVQHKAYPVTGSTATFVTLAKNATGTWSVVGEGTGP